MPSRYQHTEGIPQSAPAQPYQQFHDNGSGFFSSVQRYKSFQKGAKSSDNSSGPASPRNIRRSSRGGHQPGPATHGKPESVTSATTLSDRIQSLVEDVKAAGERRGSQQISMRSSVPSVEQRSIDPPRPPKDGQEWVWFPEGYWAERPIVELKAPSKNPIFRRRSKTHVYALSSLLDVKATKHQEERQSVPRTTSDNTRSSQMRSPSAETLDTEPNQSSWKIKRGLKMKLSTNNNSAALGSLSEGLLEKTWRHLGTLAPGSDKNKNLKEIDILYVATGAKKSPRTTATVEGATSYLLKLQKERARMPSAARSATDRDSSSPTSDSKDTRTKVGIAPWHKRTSQGSLWSVGSSIRELLRGPTPNPSLSSDTQYDVGNGRKYPKVELGEPGQPTFLPSEAQRVKTPPLYKNGPDGQVRGFFFDMRPPDDEESGQSNARKDLFPPVNNTPISRPTTTPELIHSKAPQFRSQREWWDLDCGPAARALERKSPAEFVLSIPEHLISSPLCPLHPKNKSGGKGVCVYHGRRRSMDGSEPEDP